MGIFKGAPVLICNTIGCGNEVTTSMASCNYKMNRILITRLRQNGDGSSYYQEDRKKTGIVCDECIAKISEESPTFKKLIGNLDNTH